MIIHYDPQTLQPVHIVTQYPPDYVQSLQDQEHWLEWGGDCTITQLSLTQSPMGDVEVKILEFMAVTGPSDAQVGKEVVFAPVPEGSRVVVNGVDEGEMDASEKLEFTPNAPGTYTFAFSHPSYVRMEVKLEARS